MTSLQATHDAAIAQLESNSVDFDLEVRGEIPHVLSGSLIIAASRRNKDRAVFSRWHDSDSDLIRLDLSPGRPGRIRGRILSVGPSDQLLCRGPVGSGFYSSQPNHGINTREDTVWATNLLFGAPLEVDLITWRPTRILRVLEPSPEAPQLTSTAHFAWSLDRRYAYFHQSRLQRETADSNARAADLSLVELDTKTGGQRVWSLLPPPEDPSLESANFHSAFYFEEFEKCYVALLRTGVVLECLAAHPDASEHEVTAMPVSTIWIVCVDKTQTSLQASLLPGVSQLNGLALSHLDVDASGGDGFVLYANYKQADVAEETHGRNLYGEEPDEVSEHYAGMTVEALNYGMLLRYERRAGKASIRTFKQPYIPGRTSRGHTWLPINMVLGSTGEHVFCTFSGFRPRLLPKHVAAAYSGLVADLDRIRYVPPLLMRFRADSLTPDYDPKRRHLSYAEPMAVAVVGDRSEDYVCTFGTDVGLRIYRGDDFRYMVCEALAPQFMNWRDSHYRPQPAHMEFQPR